MSEVQSGTLNNKFTIHKTRYSINCADSSRTFTMKIKDGNNSITIFPRLLLSNLNNHPLKREQVACKFLPCRGKVMDKLHLWKNNPLSVQGQVDSHMMDCRFMMHLTQPGKHQNKKCFYLNQGLYYVVLLHQLYMLNTWANPGLCVHA